MCKGGRAALPPPHISSICLCSAVCQQSLCLLCFLSVLFSTSFILPLSLLFPALLFFHSCLLSLSFYSFPFPAFLSESFPGLLFSALLVFHSLQLTYPHFPLTFTPLPLLFVIFFFPPSSFSPPFVPFLSSFAVYLFPL